MNRKQHRKMSKHFVVSLFTFAILTLDATTTEKKSLSQVFIGLYVSYPS